MIVTKYSNTAHGFISLSIDVTEVETPWKIIRQKIMSMQCDLAVN
jgi:hypothetical protein